MHDSSETVTPGGAQTPKGFVFELSGGDLALDFANTVDDRLSEEPRELLATYDDLLDWASQAGVLSASEREPLSRAARRGPKPAAALVKDARVLRESIFVIFSSIARCEDPPADALHTFNEFLPGALMHIRVAVRGNEPVWEWEDTGTLDRPLWPVIRAAAELLAAADRGRVRECASDTCAWLFLDRSKNRSRRWCDMTVCGNRAKARRYRATRA